MNSIKSCAKANVMLAFFRSAGLFAAVVIPLSFQLFGAENGKNINELNLVPWPKTIKPLPDSVILTSRSRIVAADPRLLPLAGLLAGEIELVTGLKTTLADGQPAPGDIGLQLDSRLQGEAYSLEARQAVLVRGGNYGAVALGAATVLQLVGTDQGLVSIPGIAITDAPSTEYRGLLVDVARRYHSIDNLKQMVQLCRLYKIRYLQLHLTDDQAFTFPSTAYPQLTSKNHHGGPSYTLEQLKDLVAYADARYVTIIPEYEVPGHSAAANRAIPDLFLIKGTKPYEHHASINFAKAEVMRAVATIVGEMCDVFRSSPYFHIGGDEADLALANQNEDFKAAFKRHNLPNQHQLYRKFVADMNEIVKQHGKTMIVWEGFGREPGSPVQIPTDVIVMAYEIRFYMPDHLVADGYRVVNASWTPLYVVNRGRPPAEIYDWQLRQFKPYGARPAEPGVIVAPDQPVFGAQMCAWEQPEAAELPNERHRLPAMSERIWNPGAGKSYDDFARRSAATDRILDLLAHQFHARVEGLEDPHDYRFERELTLRLSPSPAVAGTIHYTLGGKAPTLDSPAYAEPLRLSDTTVFQARIFSANGAPLGYPRNTRYELHPISGKAGEPLPDGQFGEPVNLRLNSSLEGEIRYTLDGKEPGLASPVYAGPIKIEQSAKVRATLFSGGRKKGETWARNYMRVDYEKNLTTGKPVKASGIEAGYRPENAVDGIVDLDKAWWASPYPQWLQVDLEAVHTLDRLHLFPYWGGNRYYQYTVELSVDGRNWTQVVDMSRNTQPSTSQGDLHQFPRSSARFLRINMRKNSANPGVHLVEVRAYEAK